MYIGISDLSKSLFIDDSYTSYISETEYPKNGEGFGLLGNMDEEGRRVEHRRCPEKQSFSGWPFKNIVSSNHKQTAIFS